MKKLLILLFFFVSISATFSQRIRTTPSFDADTTTRPKAGLYGIGVRSNNAYLIPATGNNTQLANYSLFTGLTNNYLPKWNGSKLIPSLLFENGTNVGIGTTTLNERVNILGGISFQDGSPNLYNSGTTGRILITANSTGGVTSGGGVALRSVSSSTNPNGLELYAGGLERLRINSSGSLGIGTTSLTGYNIRISKNITGAVGTIAVASDGVIQSDVTSSSVGFQSTIQTQAASFTLANYAHFQAVEGTIGAGSAIGTQTGYRVGSLANGTTIYGFRATISSAANRWNIHLDGTAQNWFRGNVGIGSGKSVPSFELDVAGTTQSTAFRLSANNTAPATSTTACTIGELRIDGNFIYYCSATNTWKRAALSTY